ncbi:MAG: DUF3842 family protein [Clostridia bacterium]|nr:DUF3842 family protein [Clostridia bacterium]
MIVVVMDAQGGGVGRMLVEQMKKRLPEQKLIAVGTNSAATAAMLRAGADQGATGENAVRVNAARADLIIAPIGLALCDAMLGEVTGGMALAVGGSPGHKILVPVSRCGVTIAGTPAMTLAEAVSQAVEQAVLFVNNNGIV